MKVTITVECDTDKIKDLVDFLRTLELGIVDAQEINRQPDFEPDWSKAPEWATQWAVDGDAITENGNLVNPAYWYTDEAKLFPNENLYQWSGIEGKMRGAGYVNLHGKDWRSTLRHR